MWICPGLTRSQFLVFVVIHFSILLFTLARNEQVVIVVLKFHLEGLLFYWNMFFPYYFVLLLHYS